MKHVLCILGKVFQSIEWHFNSTETCCNIHNSHCCMLATYGFSICLRLLKDPTRMFNKTPTQKKQDILKAQPIFSSFQANETSVQTSQSSRHVSSHGKERTCFKILPFYIVTSHEWCLNIYDSEIFKHSSHSGTSYLGTSRAPSSAWQRQRCSVPKCVHSTPPPAIMDNPTQGLEAATDWGRNHKKSPIHSQE